jgi:excisionase family DNA binding protein
MPNAPILGVETIDVMNGELSQKTMGLADSLRGRTSALNVSEIAELLNVSERQVYKLVAEHRIPCFKIGGSIRFDPFAIAIWLRQKMAPASVGYVEERQRGA